MTRRGLLSAIPVLSAVSSAQEAEAPAAKPTREQDLDNARAAARANSDALARVQVPQATEPAFQFKA